MPTWTEVDQFRRQFRALSRDVRRAFRLAVRRFVADLRRDGQSRKGLRVKRFQGRPDWWEMTWAPDGRALFSYGSELHTGEAHIVWQRIGGHNIFENA